jgi:hypothetical protein
MRAADHNLELLRTVAERLGPLRDQVVFVGGAATGLLVTDPAAPTPRPTKDVDVIVEVASLAEYQTTLREQLLDLGFAEDTAEDAPLCRKLGTVSPSGALRRRPRWCRPAHDQG